MTRRWKRCYSLARQDRMDRAITEMAANSEYTPVVRRLCCQRGVSPLTGFGLGCGDRGLATVHRWQHLRLPGIGATEVLLRCGTLPGVDPRDREHLCPPPLTPELLRPLTGERHGRPRGPARWARGAQHPRDELRPSAKATKRWRGLGCGRAWK